MAKRGSKRPRQAFDVVPSGKEPRKAPNVEVTWLECYPEWRFKHAVMTGLYGWHCLTAKHVETVLAGLGSFEGMLWRDIIQKKSCHSMHVDQYDTEIGKIVRSQGLEIDDELFQLRVGAKGRILGWRVNQVLQILFWDPEHRAYKVEPKNT